MCCQVASVPEAAHAPCGAATLRSALSTGGNEYKDGVLVLQFQLNFMNLRELCKFVVFKHHYAGYFILVVIKKCGILTIFTFI